MRKDKARLLRGNCESEIPGNEGDKCEDSAVNVIYIAALFGIATGAIAIYKWFFTRDNENIPNSQPVTHHRVERVAEPDPPDPEPDNYSLD